MGGCLSSGPCGNAPTSRCSMKTSTSGGVSFRLGLTALRDPKPFPTVASWDKKLVPSSLAFICPFLLRSSVLAQVKFQTGSPSTRHMALTKSQRHRLSSKRKKHYGLPGSGLLAVWLHKSLLPAKIPRLQNKHPSKARLDSSEAEICTGAKSIGRTSHA